MSHVPYFSPKRGLHECGICLKYDPYSKTLQSFVWIDWPYLTMYGTYACPECLSKNDNEIKLAIKLRID